MVSGQVKKYRKDWQQADRKARPEHHRSMDKASYWSNVDKQRARSREYARKHREERKVYMEEYRSNHILERQAYRQTHAEEHAIHERNRNSLKRTSGVKLTKGQWEAIKSSYGHCCAYCGYKVPRLTIDHVIPLAKGGLHTLDNLVPACRPCNLSKGTREAPTLPHRRLLL